MMQEQEPLSNNDLLALAVRTVDELLPEGWQVNLAPATGDPYLDRRSTPNAQLEAIGPDGSVALFAIASRLIASGRDLPPILEALSRWQEQTGAMPLLVSRYLSPTIRDVLRESGTSSLDATGNVELSFDSPAIAISRPGLDRDPWRRECTPGTLAGEPSGRVARALCDFETPLPVSLLSATAGTSAGATYRALDLLIDEGLVEKGERGWVTAVDWQGVLKRWAHDWSKAEQRFVTRLNLNGGVSAAIKTLQKLPADSYVVGGSQAAAALIGAKSEPRQLVVHCDSAVSLAADLDARPARRNDPAELIVHGRALSSAAARATRRRNITVAAPTQAYADLVLSDDSGADELLKALAAKTSAWRRAPR